MMVRETMNYGSVSGVILYEDYDDGSLKECTVNKKNEILTRYGSFVPQYEDGGERRKLKHSLVFHKNGNLKRVCMQDKIMIKTECGEFPAESILFHKNGDVRKIFPLNGKLTGFWTWENEFKLAEELKIKTPIGSLNEKAIALNFYEKEKLRSITFWPGSKVKLDTTIGEVLVRVGVSFYENGSLKSLEPAKPVSVKTLIGDIMAFDNDPLGIHGDSNSLCLNIDGTIKRLLTATDKVILIDKNGEEKFFEPSYKVSLCSDTSKVVVPLEIEFEGEELIFNKKEKFKIEDYKFLIKKNIAEGSSVKYVCS